MQRAFGWAQRGGLSVVEDLSGGVEVVQESFPSCTVTVYNTGTVTLSTIFDDALGATPKANPFTASSTAYWYFYAADGTYDVRFSGTGIAVPFTLGGYQLKDESVGSAWFNVTAIPYSAAGDGVTDDTAAIQAATTAAAAAGGVVYFPEGKYLIDGTITVSAGRGVTFKGDGYSPTGTLGSFLKKVTTGKMFNLDWAFPGSDDLVLFEDLFMYGGAAALDGSHMGIYARNAHGLKINRCFITSFGGYGAFLYDGWGARIRDSVLASCGLSGLSLFRRCNNVVVDGCAINGNCRSDQAGYGNIHISGDAGHTFIHDGISIIDCDCEGAGTTPFGAAPATAYGLMVDDVYGLNISGGHFEENLTKNILINSNVKAAHIGGGIYIQTQGIDVQVGAEVTTGEIYFSNGAGMVGPAQSAARVFDVRAYGAVGNGVADDTAAVQAAIDACEAAGGGTVFFPPGTYNLTAILSVDVSCVRFIGAGVSSVVSQTTNNLGVVSIANAVNDIEIAGLYLKSASGAVTQAGRGVIYANPVGGASGVSRLDIHHCRIDAGSTCGISGNGFIDSKIHDNHIDNLGTGEHGIYLSSAGIDSTRTIVSNNTITSSDLTGDYGVCIRGCTFIEVYGNEITGFAGSVISGVGTGTDDLSVHDNKLKSPGYDGWINFEAASDRNSIINNQITSAGRNGIRTDVELYDSLIVGNLITLPAASGMRFNGLTRSSIINNVFVDCDSDSNGAGGDDSSGIRLNSSNPNNTITGNVVISSNVANFHKYCLSVSGTGNTGNRCYNNDFRAARSAPLDIDGSATWVLPINGFSTALATTAVDGFLYVPTCAGTPTGVPTVVTGMAPLVFDTSNNKLYVYDGGWVDVT